MASTLATAIRDDLAKLLAPLTNAAHSPSGWTRLLGAIGHTRAVSTHPGLVTALQSAAQAVDTLAQLDDAALSSWDGIGRVIDLAEDVLSAVRGIEKAVADPALADVAAGLGLDLTNYLVGLYLRSYHLRLFRVAGLLTLVEPVELVAVNAVQRNAGGDVTRLAWRQDQLHLERIGDLIEKPWTTLGDFYFPNGLAAAADAHASAQRLFPLLGMVAQTLGLPYRQDLLWVGAPQPPPVIDAPEDDTDRDHLNENTLSPDDGNGTTASGPPPDPTTYLQNTSPRFVFVLRQTDAGTPVGARLAVALNVSSASHPGNVAGWIVGPTGDLNWSQTDGDWKLTFTSQGQVGAVVIGPGGVKLAPSSTPTTGATGRFTVARVAAPGEPAFRLGSASGSRLELGAVQLGIDFALSPQHCSLGFTVDVQQAALILAGGDGDGLVAKLLPSGGLSLECDVGLRASSDRGIDFGVAVRGAPLSGDTTIGRSIGPIFVDRLSRTVQPIDDARGSGVTVGVGVQWSATLGPITASFDGPSLGADLLWTLKDASRAPNLGLFDVDGFGLHAPTGVGLSIDAGVVEGGGYLGHSGHRYEGAFDLTVFGVAVKAYGLIETELPGGAAGYSALVILSAEFSPGLQIGFGFTLDGVGGLLGLHRTLSIESVQAAVWGHHFDGLLFPKDPIAAAPSLMTAIDSYFPAAEGRYLFGPLAKIGWGDGMAEALVGLVLEVPSPVRLLLLGEIDVHVPVVAPQLELHIDFDGGVDFGKKLAFFDATLHDSKIERYPIVGGLAFRYAWGDEPELVLSLGGFNPHYQPPANFPALQRLGITIGDSGAQLVAQAYVAVTSNTLQFGAKAELTAGTGSFNVHGWLGFDALVERNPFAFAFDISAGLELRHHTSVLASVHLEGHVSGTAPWHVSGEASISCWFFDISVHFDKSWGGTATALPATDPMPAVQAALAQPSAWTSVLAAAVKAAVTVQSAPTDAGGAVLLEPAGALRVAQRVVPLGEPITRFGGTPLGRTLTLGIDALNVQGKTSWTATTEEFAPAQYEEMSDAEKLSLPSFTRMTAGAQIGGEDVDVGQSGRTRAVETQLEYDTEVIDTWTAPRRPVGTYAPTLGAQLAMNGRSGGARPATPPPRVRLAPEQYVIAGASDLTARGDLGGDGSKRGALRALAQYLDSNPAARDQLQVVLAHEAA